MTEECIDGLCPIETRVIPEFIKTTDASVLNKEIPVDQDNAYSEELERARDDNGQFIPDDESTEDINEAYTPRKKTVKEFTCTEVVGDIIFIQVTGGYAPDFSFNSKKYPVTDELLDFYLTLGDAASVVELKQAREFISEDTF